MTRRDYYLFTLFLMLWILLSWSASLREILAGAFFAAAGVFIMRPIGAARGEKPKENMLRRAVEVSVFAAAVLGDLFLSSARILARSFYRVHYSSTRQTIHVTLKDEAALTLLSLAMTLTTDAAVIDTDRASRQIDCWMLNEPGGAERTELLIRRYETMLSRVFD